MKTLFANSNIFFILFLSSLISSTDSSFSPDFQVANCAVCSDPTDCDECKDGYWSVKENGYFGCYISCPFGYWKYAPEKSRQRLPRFAISSRALEPHDLKRRIKDIHLVEI
jgi:hypothetical protein